MPRRRRAALVLPLILAVAACTPGPTPTVAPASAARGAEVRPTAPKQAPGAAVGGPAVGGPAAAAGVAPPRLISGPAAGLVGLDGATLAGVVRAPAGLIGPDGGTLISDDGSTLISDDGSTLISDDGSTLISDDGSTLISDDGSTLVSGGGAALAGAGTYHVAQAPGAEAPVVRVRVYLADALGRLVASDDGRPISAETDAAGRFVFRGFTTARNLVAIVPLARGAALRAFVPRGGGAAGAPEVAVDVAGTIAAGYIEAAFVRRAADPLATLERLEAPAVAEARRLAEAGLAAGRAALPRLSGAALAGTAAALRRTDPAFDAHMAAVARMLAAGQADQGAGRPAVEVALAGVEAIAPLGAELLIAAATDNRVWRLGADGRLTAFAGIGTPAAGRLAPGPAGVAPLGGPTHLVPDRAGGAVLLEWLDEFNGRRVSRLTADGRLTPLAPPFDPAWAAPGPDGTTLVGERGLAARVWTHSPDGTWAARHDLPAAASRAFLRLRRYGVDARGRVILGAEDPAEPAAAAVWRYDPADGAFEALPLPAGRRGLTVAAGGEVLVLGAEGRLEVRRGDEPPRTLAAPADLALRWDGAAFAADGTLHLGAAGVRVLRLRDGEAAVVAGRPAVPAGRVADLALQDPAGVATGPAGAMWIADRGAHRVFQVAPDGRVTTVAGTGEVAGAGEPDGRAVEARLSQPSALRRDAAGDLYVLEQIGWTTWRIRRLGADGAATTLVETAATITDLAVSPDGTVYWATFESLGFADTRVRLHRRTPDGAVDVPVDDDARLGAQLTLALDAGGDAVLLWGNGWVHAWSAATGLARDVVVAAGFASGANRSGLAVAPDGTLYAIYDRLNQVVRVDRRTGQVTQVAGPGGPLLGGSGVDDGLQAPGYLAFTPEGDLLVADAGHRQIKRLPAERLGR